MQILDRLNVCETGNPMGQPMVFAHGFGCDQTMWRGVTPAFVDTHRIITFDVMGCGFSDTSCYNAEDYSSLERYAADVTEIIEALNLQDVIMVGHSVSAMIGVLATIAEPARFAGLVMVSPSPSYINEGDYVGGFSRGDIDELMDSLDSNYLGWATSMAPVIMDNPDRPDMAEELRTSFCRMDPKIARKFARVTFLSDNRNDLARVSVPTLILQCEFDAIAPKSVGQFVHDQVRDSQLRVLDVAGHCPNLSAPDVTIEAMKPFVREVSARP